MQHQKYNPSPFLPGAATHKIDGAGALVPDDHQVAGTQFVQQPIAQIDWVYLEAQRPIILKHIEDMPPYLLQTEIKRILSAAEHLQTQFLLNTLWHTGARISEALALTRADLQLEHPYPYLSLPRAKVRGRPKKGAPKPRFIPLCDETYLQQARTYLASTTGRAGDRIFPFHRQTAARRLDQVLQQLPSQPSIKVTLHTFRHSFAVNAVLHFVDVATLQAWLGHKRRETTEIYTRVLSAETTHLMARVTF